MDSTLSNLLIQLLIYGIVLTAFRLMLRRPLISASLAFWLAWALLIYGGILAESKGWRLIDTFSAPYLAQLFNGAFVGFAAASIIKIRRVSTTRYLQLVAAAEWVLARVAGKVMVITFLVGVIFLAQRIGTVGLSVEYLSNVRDVYNQREESLFARVSSHLMVLLTMLVILQGLVDSHRGADIRSLAKFILVAAPFGLAQGARIFLLSFVIAYLSSLLLTRSRVTQNMSLLRKREAIALGALVSFLLVVFALMGFFRGGYGAEFDLLYTILIWPVSTLTAMDSWVNEALRSGQTYGLNTFGWIWSNLSRLGILDTSPAMDIMQSVGFYFQDTQNSARVIPRSILPDLLMDFGPQGVFFGMAVIAFGLECLSRFVGRGFFYQVLAVQAFFSSAMTIQTSVFNPPVMTSIFWAAVLALYMRNRWRTEAT